MKEKLLMIALVSFGNVGYSQYNKGYNEPKPVVSINDSWTFPSIEQFDGTYQFIVHKKKNFLISSETLQLIADSRKQDEDVVLTLSPYLSVEIPSQNKVTSTSFVPFSTTYLFHN